MTLIENDIQHHHEVYRNGSEQVYAQYRKNHIEEMILRDNIANTLLKIIETQACHSQKKH